MKRLLILLCIGTAFNAYAVFNRVHILARDGVKVIAFSDKHMRHAYSQEQKEQLFFGAKTLNARLIVEDNTAFEHLFRYFQKSQKKLRTIQKFVSGKQGHYVLSSLSFLTAGAIERGIDCTNVEFRHPIFEQSSECYSLYSFEETCRVLYLILEEIKAVCLKIIPKQYQRVNKMLDLLCTLLALFPESYQDKLKKKPVDDIIKALYPIRFSAKKAMHIFIRQVREVASEGNNWLIQKLESVTPREGIALFYKHLLNTIIDLRILKAIFSVNQGTIIVCAGGGHIDPVSKALKNNGFSEETYALNRHTIELQKKRKKIDLDAILDFNLESDSLGSDDLYNEDQFEFYTEKIDVVDVESIFRMLFQWA